MYYLYALNNNVWVNILPNSNNLTWTSDKDTLATELTFDSIYNLDVGTQIALKNDMNIVIAGTIIKKVQKHFVTTYTGMDFAFYLNKSKTAIQFNNISASEALKQLLDRFGLTYSIVDIATNINKVFRGDEISTIIDDILELARLENGNKYVRYMDGYKLIIKPLVDLRITPKILIDKNITFTTSIENMKNKVIVTDLGVTLAETEDDVSIAKYGLLQDIFKVNKKNVSQAQNIAENYLAQNNRIFEELALNVLGIDGADDIKANRMIYIDIASFGVGDWIRIKSAQHTISNSKHTVSIALDNSLDDMLISDEGGESDV